MIDPKYTDLMNLVLDGVATPAQRSELEAYLSAHPETRPHFDALSRLVHRLDSQPLTDAPAALEPRILEAVERTPQRRGQPVEAGISRRFKEFLAPPRLRPWPTFGLGLAAGVFLFAAVQFGRSGAWDVARDVDPAQVSGSMVKPADREPVGSISVNTPSGTVSGSALFYRAGGETIVDVELQSTVPVEWSLEFDADAWSLTRVEKNSDATGAFAANPGSIRGLHTGEGGVRVAFSGPGDAAQSVVFKVVEGGDTVFEGTPSSIRQE